MERFTISEYSLKMGVSKQSIYSKIKRGTLRSIIIDNKMFIEIDNIDNTKKTTIKPTLNNIEQQQNEILLELIKELKKDNKRLQKEIKTLNKKLNKEKDNSIDVLKSFIGEMKTLTYKDKNYINGEIIQTTKDKKKKTKK